MQPCWCNVDFPVGLVRSLVLPSCCHGSLVLIFMVFVFHFVCFYPPPASSHLQIGSRKGFYTLFLYAGGRISFRCHDGGPDLLIMVSFPSSSLCLRCSVCLHSAPFTVSLCFPLCSCLFAVSWSLSPNDPQSTCP